MTKNKKLSAALVEAVEQTSKEVVTIKKANIKEVRISIEGTTPYCQNRFSSREDMEAKQRAGSTARKNKERAAKNFEALYEAAKHIGIDNKQGMPAAAFRAASISASRLVGFKMTIAKLSIFIVPDTFDKHDMSPLVHFSGEAQMHIGNVRLPSGVIDLRPRPLWAPGWTAKPRVQFDADQFTLSDVYNLFERVGAQVGIGEGRNDSRNSAGMGWGCFKITN